MKRYADNPMRVTFVHRGMEHLGLELLSSILKERGHAVSLAYDPGLFSPSDNIFYIPRLAPFFERRADVDGQIDRSAPDVIALAAYTSTYRWSLETARRAKERRPGVPVVFGGSHPTLAPETVMENPFVDFAVVGEAEESFPELLDDLAAGGDGSKVPGVWCRKNGRVQGTPPRPLNRDLSRLPLFDKSLFEKYLDYRNEYMTVASRGCIFHCRYCSEATFRRMYGRGHRRLREAGDVMGELILMKDRYDYGEVMFFDSILFADKGWLARLMDRFRREIGVPYRCFGQVSLMDEEVARILKDSGCYAVNFGLQTVNARLRREILGRPESQEQVIRAFEICDEHRLRYDVDHIFGLPGETLEDHKAAALFYKRFRYLNRVKCHNLAYFPKAWIIDMALEAGDLAPDDVRAVEEGLAGGFHHLDYIKDPQKRAWRDQFQALYKLIPLLPGPVMEKIVEGDLYRFLGKIPKTLEIALQVAAHLRTRDYRFYIVLVNYLYKVLAALRGRGLGEVASGGGAVKENETKSKKSRAAF